MSKINKKFLTIFLTLALIFGFSGQVWALNSTEIVSKSTAGVLADQYSDNGFISGDGRYVVFSSNATNLVAGDTNATHDAFLRDTQLDTTVRVSVSTAGVEGNNGSYEPQISSDGRYIVFSSDSTNLVAGDTNGVRDVFLRDTQLNTTTRVSISTAGTEGNETVVDNTIASISNDGRYVFFQSTATNLVAGDTNALPDVFMRDTQSNTTTRVSVSTAGAEADQGVTSDFVGISDDGRYLIFTSESTNLITGDTAGFADVFLRDTQLNTTTRISVDSLGIQGNGASYASAGISSDGRYITFISEATNLVDDDTNSQYDAFLLDTQTNTMTRVSVSSLGIEGNDYSGTFSVSDDGQYVSFYSDATNLVSGDTNGVGDIFLYSIISISAPTTTTTSSSSITTTTATLTGNITDTGGEANTIRGFDIGTDNTYTMTDITESGSYSSGSYSLTATGLTCNTTYHYRAYSTNTSGTGTGSDDTFTTSACPVAAPTGGAVPVWILQSINNQQTINQNSAPVIPSIPTPQPTPQPKFQFTKNLKYRDRSTDVLELQKFLNSNGYTVSNTGAGSIGFETTYFGPATRNALTKFQKDNNIKPAVGYFGVITRGVVNK